MRIKTLKHAFPGLALMCLAATVATAHVDSPLLTDACGSCHVGHGMSGEPMLEKSEEDFCYLCHGSDEARAEMMAQGRLVNTAKLSDMRAEFDKPFSHPVDRTGGHSPTEQLPSYAGNKTPHAECVDCHNPHERISHAKDMDFGVKGYTLTGQYQDRALYEYNICLKCHTDLAGADRGGRSLVRDFDRSVRSQHPVTNGATGNHLPSLREPIPAGGRMKCSNCHRSDDPSAPAGPHGSMYEFMLSGNYSREIYLDESSFAYEFCYQCHDRMSLLANESFPLHREHIEGDLVTGRKGTSCFTCHASHGSPLNPHLIEFNLQAVQAADGTGQIEYLETGTGSGSCVLKCHNHNHAPGRY